MKDTFTTLFDDVRGIANAAAQNARSTPQANKPVTAHSVIAYVLDMAGVPTTSISVGTMAEMLTTVDGALNDHFALGFDAGQQTAWRNER